MIYSWHDCLQYAFLSKKQCIPLRWHYYYAVTCVLGISWQPLLLKIFLYRLVFITQVCSFSVAIWHGTLSWALKEAIELLCCVNPAHSNFRHSLLHSWSSLVLFPPSSCVTIYLETCLANWSWEEIAHCSQLAMDCTEEEGVITYFPHPYTSTLCFFCLLLFSVLFTNSYPDWWQPGQINYLQLKFIFKEESKVLLWFLVHYLH